MFKRHQIKNKVFNPECLVLILGRDRETRLLMKTLLELWSYRIIEARTVREAICNSENHFPNIILMDADSSFGKILEDLSNLRRDEKFNAIPVIVISNYRKSTFRDITPANRANHFFTKPLNFTRLESSLKKFAVQENKVRGVSL